MLLFKVPLLFLFLFGLSEPEPVDLSLLQRRWKMQTWIDLDSGEDLLLTEDKAKYRIRFKKESVLIREKSIHGRKRYDFYYETQNDSVSIQNLGSLKVLRLDKQQLVLKVDSPAIFDTTGTLISRWEITFRRAWF